MALSAHFIHVALESVASTNDEAERLLKEGAAAQTVVTAKTQTAGRGRYGRAWVSEEGNLYASLILKPATNSVTWGQVGFVISLSIAEAVASLLPSPDKVKLKWPNDVLVEDKKIAGVLLEIKQDANGDDALIVGFGVNLVSHPPHTDTPATHMVEHDVTLPPERVLEAILQLFEGRYALWQEKGFVAIRPAWLALAKDLKKPVSVRFGGKEVKGEFVDIGSDDGALYIRKADGETERLSAGDIYFGQG